MSEYMPDKDPANIEPYFFVFCDKSGLNDGSLRDRGELKGATIAGATVTAASGLTVDSKNTDAVTIDGTDYAVNTVVTAWLSGGSDGTTYLLECTITTSDSRTLKMSMQIPVKDK